MSFWGLPGSLYRLYPLTKLPDMAAALPRLLSSIGSAGRLWRLLAKASQCAVNGLLAAVIAFAALVLLGPWFIPFNMLTVLSSSMTPAIPVGAVVVIRPVETEAVRVGDIITFQDPSNPMAMVTHRVIGVTVLGDSRFFETQGDANPAPDRDLVPSDFVIGRVILHIPMLGQIIQFVRKPFGFSVVVGAPLLLIIVGEVINIIRLICEGERQSGLRRRGRAFRGSLRDFSPIQVLNLVTLGSKTGTLSVEHNGSRATLVFQTGKLVYAAIDENDGSLASVLELVGRVNREQATSLRRHAARTSDKHLGMVLIERGYFTRSDIIQGIKRHTIGVVNRLASWREGTFTFEIDRLSANGHITVPIDLESVIARIAHLRKSKEGIETAIPGLGVSFKCADHPGLSLADLPRFYTGLPRKQVVHEASEA